LQISRQNEPFCSWSKRLRPCLHGFAGPCTGQTVDKTMNGRKRGKTGGETLQGGRNPGHLFSLQPKVVRDNVLYHSLRVGKQREVLARSAELATMARVVPQLPRSRLQDRTAAAHPAMDLGQARCVAPTTASADNFRFGPLTDWDQIERRAIVER
jgi:hypothetical protein